MKRLLTKRHRTRLLTAAFLLLAAAAVVYGALHFLPQPSYPANDAGKTLVINEIAAKNLPVRNANGGLSDWVELYNYGDAPVELDGFGFSDDADEPFRYTFPHGTTIEGGAYLILYADANGTQTAKKLCAPFGLRADETLLLTDTNGRLIDKARLPATLEEGTAVGRNKNDCREFAVLTTPTPGTFNHSAIYAPLQQLSEEVAPPAFSADGGYYDAPFSLTLTADDPDAVIYYTTDGSEPTRDSETYDAPIPIRSRDGEKNRYAGIETSALYYRFSLKSNDTPVYKGTVIRAKCCKNNVLSEETATQTYFIRPHYSLPVVSVVTDPASLFDEDNGIYVPGTKMKLWKKYNPETPAFTAPPQMHYSDATVDAHAEIYDTDGACLFSGSVGLSISGNTTSYQRCKNLGMVCSKKYGSPASAFRADVFDGGCVNAQGKPITSFRTIRLRTSGGGVYDGTMLKDAYLQTLAAPEYPFTLAYRPAVVFIDGEYWGIHNFREKYENEYFQQHFGVNRKSVTFFKNDYEEAAAPFNRFVEQAEKLDLSVRQNYDFVAQTVDLDNMIRYFAIECYLNNGDFCGKNVGLWRADDAGKPYGDNRWRFMLYDLDAAFEFSEGELLKEIVCNTDSMTEYAYIRLFRCLLKNDTFRTKLIRTICEYGQTIFAPQAASERLDKMLAVVAPEMREHCSRWQMVRGPVGRILELFGAEQAQDLYTHWETSQDTLRAQMTARPEKVRQVLTDVFGEEAEAIAQTVY